MEFILLLLALIILSETTLLTIKTRSKPLISSHQKRKIYIDTSVLMDPRLLAVAQTGFLADDLIVPRSVIHELQLLADGKDHDKRTRARAGLDAVRELERITFFDLTIYSDALDHTPVDNRLLELAKTNLSLLLSADVTLIPVADTDHLEVLSLSELALALRNEYLPGERARVKVVATGSNAGQGVAYLKDGTMVVIDHGKSHLGQEVDVEFVRLNQTAAGTMMFARLARPRAKRRSTSKRSS